MFGIDASLIALAITQAKLSRLQREAWDRNYLAASPDQRELMRLNRELSEADERNRRLCDAIRSKKISLF